ncbi:torso-like protein [Cydia pomonella]|uniref:torso-like protein n=1 Tax=Cydia pomonella TaxID=82600 RepID=UPI002ADE31F5|nr:torso-like protein [Cydia pomonella]
MFTVLFIICLRVAFSASDDSDLGYSLSIGNAINVFANYGDLSQVTQVISADYDDDEDEFPEPFSEKNIKVFLNASSKETPGEDRVEMNILLCETFDELLDGYFQNFQIEGTDKPWKAFMGDWIQDEIMRTLGIDVDLVRDNCCYVLLKLSKVHKTVKIDSLDHVAVKSYVEKAMSAMNGSDVADIRKFMRSYGTHYIDSYVTGNFVYQVFKFKRYGYNMLRSYVRDRKHHTDNSDRLRSHFASNFLRQVGNIRIASGNKTLEAWARRNLLDSQYLYYRPSLLRLFYNNALILALNRMLDDGALLGLSLKTLAPLFKDEQKRKKYVEVVENDMKLWEVNA